MDPLPESQEALIAFLQIPNDLPDEGKALIWKAYGFAKERHADQRRESGAPAITHLLDVARIIVDYKLDVEAICAALLHDILEDTPTRPEELELRFGPAIAHLVDGVTRLSKHESEGMSKPQMDAKNLRKLFVAMVTDPRVAVIRLADRLHNMRTIAALPKERQKQLALETMEIFAPLAELFGIWQIKRELEDTSFRYIDEQAYNSVSAAINQDFEQRRQILDTIIHETRELIRKQGYRDEDVEISGRPKHIYSIYKKLQTAKYKGQGVERIYDKLGIRIVVASLEQCYGVLGLIHARWPAIPGEFDDFISMRLPSGYQSLHTAVRFGPEKHDIVEFQIRTREMHNEAEYGIAAHWLYKYKDGFGKRDANFETKLTWLRGLVDSWRDVTDPHEFVESLKVEVLDEKVYVYTPMGKIIDLPVGSTPLDFAYRIHTQIGHSCAGAKVNNRMVPLDYQLHSGEIVQIITSKNARGPSRDWLNFVKTSGARGHIRRYFKRLNRAENEAAGRDLLEKELKRLGLSVPFEEIAQLMGARSIEDVFAQIGSGDTTARAVAQKILAQRAREEAEELADIPQVAPQPERKPDTKGITVRGVDGLLTRLAKCCNPVLGEPIVGFVTRGKGITVHRADCRTIQNERDRARLVEVTWGEANPKQGYPVLVRIEAWDRLGLWRDISGTVADAGINIQAVEQLPTRKPDRAILQATLLIQSLSQLTSILDKLNRLPDVIEARREQSGVAQVA